MTQPSASPATANFFCQAVSLLPQDHHHPPYCHHPIFTAIYSIYTFTIVDTTIITLVISKSITIFAASFAHFCYCYHLFIFITTVAVSLSLYHCISIITIFHVVCSSTLAINFHYRCSLSLASSISNSIYQYDPAFILITIIVKPSTYSTTAIISYLHLYCCSLHHLLTLQTIKLKPPSPIH